MLLLILVGHTYPVIETAVKDSEQSLMGKKCMEGFDSHYVLVKGEGESNLIYQPCDPTKDIPDYDEVVVFNKSQILPRYLVYYKRIDTKKKNNEKSVHLLWVDPNDNSDTLQELQKNNIVVTQFKNS